MIQSNITPAALLPAVVEVVSQAGALIRAEFHRPGGPRGGGSKAPIDTEVEILLKDRLLGLHPCGFVGEETGRTLSSGGDTWVVDPQDGTTDFLAGRRGSAISVALLRAGRPVLGVVYAPVAPDDRGDLVAWADGAALTRNGRPVRRAQNGEPPVVAMNAQAADHARHNHETLPGFRVRTLPSPAYRLALVAAGEVDAAVSLVAGLDRWDIAGGHALLIGAGCTLGSWSATGLLADADVSRWRGRILEAAALAFGDEHDEGDAARQVDNAIARGRRTPPDVSRWRAPDVGTLQRAPMLTLAEAEFTSDSEMAVFVPPEWCGREVTDDPQYSGGRLVLRA